jgi:hypothetical protein
MGTNPSRNRRPLTSSSLTATLSRVDKHKADPIDIMEGQDLQEEEVTLNNINAGNVPNKIDIVMINAAAFHRNLTQKDNVAFSVTMCEIDQILSHREREKLEMKGRKRPGARLPTDHSRGSFMYGF